MVEAKSSFKFTNLKCQVADADFCRFETCKLSVVGRGIVSLNIRVQLFKTPVTNTSVHFLLYRKDNGRRKLLFNVHQDVCAYFLKPNRFSLAHAFFNFFAANSNINHSCPYDDDIIVKDLILDEDKVRLVPLPEGEFILAIQVFAYNKLRASVETFFYRKDFLYFKG
ncbi:uncharacterized protein LOC131997357 [Stomoxys calcitrans]|uniref:uncharacterized protein LOC131997357 n=1 Tax=Stomoxys calcitrans TaxID=35570 RepID=UPI0027E380C7|nr:uncharacterized protein LOC131997357 [Stomoxys calcitrans]